MPPILALILTIIFILFLLHLDQKQNPTASRALWIPTFWILVVTSKALGLWTGSVGVNMEEGSELDRVCLSVLTFIGILILINRNFNWMNIIKNNSWLMILFAFMFISVLWSEIPFILLKRWIRVIGATSIMACIVASEVDPRQAVRSVFRRIIYIHMPLSILLIKYYPLWGVEFHRWTGEVMWNGVSTQKNGLAQLCLFAIFFIFWTFIRRWRGFDKPVTWYHTYIEVFVVILALWLFTGPNHTLTYSSTSTATLTIGITVLLSFQWMKSKNIILDANLLAVFILLIIIYGTVTPFLGGLSIFDASVLGRDESLTGRSNIWAKLIPLAMEKPFLGHGFCFWTDELGEYIKTNSGHNGYLDTIFQLGFIGLILSSIFLITICRHAGREMTRDFDWGVLWFCLIMMATIHNIAESSLNKFTGLFPMIIFIQISSQYQKTNQLSPS